MSYKRVTNKKIDLDKFSEKAKSKISDTYLEYAKMNNALWELENQIENGTIIELPCKVGDALWSVYEAENHEMFLDEGVVRNFNIDSCGLWFYVIYKSGLIYWHTIEDWGKSVFLTKAEAEKKLKELQNER